MNAPQRLQLERLKLCQMNDLDGKKIAVDLENHQYLWKSFVLGRFKWGTLIELRDMWDDEDTINADTLYVLTARSNIAAFKDMAKRWNYNEIGYNDENGKWGDVDFRNDAPMGTGDNLWQAFGRDVPPCYVLFRIWWD